ncbi:iron ABC transporter permease [Pasteurellaceae bacterium 20609_3]|uniref:FecCD family ABC transporter permease n=1 Tax=Spirabiliibacterium mucosae TaxID=28156 RepID=UPI001AADA9F4|nr:iron ABC transporter permease [Spirabiliibacterium mucosae]MBE2897986.1 iron ABC transporter permease [Spirabiliibacterium mucosae]
MTNPRLFNLFLLMLLIVLAITALCIGRYSLSPTALWQALSEPSANTVASNIIYNLRLPRILAAILVGGALALAGAAFQGVFRNPLVSPDLLGVSSGACVGASIAILLGLSILHIQALAFVGGVIAVALTMQIPRWVQRDATIVLVLAGIIVSGFMLAGLGLLKYLADPETQLADIVYWQLGSLSKSNYHNLAVLAPIMLVTLALLLAMRWRINLLSLGSHEAQLSGVNVRVERNVMVLCATLLTASSVCLCGTIGWLGLIIPHLARLMVGDNNMRVLPSAVLLGACFLLFVDTLARNLYVQEIPLGILTGFIGAPFFAWVLIKQQVLR